MDAVFVGVAVAFFAASLTLISLVNSLEVKGDALPYHRRDCRRIIRLPAPRLAQTGEVLVTGNSVIQIGLFMAVLLALVRPLGEYMARVYERATPVGG